MFRLPTSCTSSTPPPGDEPPELTTPLATVAALSALVPVLQIVTAVEGAVIGVDGSTDMSF